MNKWFRNLTFGNVTQREVPFTLRATDFKREAIYDSSNKYVATKPYVIDLHKRISPSPLPSHNRVEFPKLKLI